MEVTERICALRPVEDKLVSEKKNGRGDSSEIAREITTLLCRIFAERKKVGHADLEAVEIALRAAMHQAGAAVLSQLLQFPEPVADQRVIPCACGGQQARYRKLRSRSVLTALGAVTLTRPWYLCPQCHNGQFPLDRQLEMEKHGWLARRVLSIMAVSR